MSDEAGSAESKKVQKLVLMGTAVATVLAIAGTLFYVSPQWYQNYAPTQPIPFSHKRHAGDFKIPCLYCHASAERAAHAEVPGLETCMNCHSVVKTDSPHIQKVKEHFDAKKPMEWVKVHVLPDFVRFNHKRHISAGVACQTCHGPVETMEKVYQWAGLNMGWCMDCHRNDNYVTDRRKEWAKKEIEMGGVAGASALPRMGGAEAAPLWYKALANKHPHNADVSCTTCHY